MNRLEWILGIVLVVLLIAVAVVSLLFWFGPNRQATQGPAANSATAVAQRAVQIAPTSEFDGQTAHVAYAAAQLKAQEWQSDAQLLNASATWEQGAVPQDFVDGATTWGFVFYSPSAQQIAMISVVENVASVVSTSAHQQETAVLQASGWNLDSADVIRSLLQSGGNDFLSTQGVTTLALSLLLDDEDGNGRMEWEASLISLQNGTAIIMRQDATTGEVLAVETIPN